MCLCGFMKRQLRANIPFIGKKRPFVRKKLPFVRKAEYKLEQEGEDNYLCSRHIKILSYEKVEKNQVESVV